MNKERYFNFPIMFLKGFLKNDKKCLSDILAYSVYLHSLKLEHGTVIEKIKVSARFFKITLGSNKKTLDRGKYLYNSIEDNSPKVGINLSVYWDYNNNYKSGFEKVCLLGFLALKSILQQKPYCKITNAFWLARMDGKAKSCEFNQLSLLMSKYANEYQTKKIKTELSLNWNLKTYSRYTRGFYVSFKLSLDELVYQAEKRKRSTKENQLKSLEREALAKALKRLK